MSLRDLRAVYGQHRPVNRAIRAECPGGQHVLDARKALYDALRCRPGDPDLIAAQDALTACVQRMEAFIRRRYDIQGEGHGHE